MKIQVLNDPGDKVGTRELEKVDPYSKFTKAFFCHGGSFMVEGVKITDHNTLAELKESHGY